MHKASRFVTICALTRKWSEEPREAEEEHERFDGKLVITRSRREDEPVAEIWVGKFTDWVRPTESQKAFAAMSWLVIDEPTPSQLSW